MASNSTFYGRTRFLGYEEKPWDFDGKSGISKTLSVLLEGGTVEKVKTPDHQASDFAGLKELEDVSVIYENRRFGKACDFVLVKVEAKK